MLQSAAIAKGGLGQNARKRLCLSGRSFVSLPTHRMFICRITNHIRRPTLWSDKDQLEGIGCRSVDDLSAWHSENSQSASETSRTRLIEFTRLCAITIRSEVPDLQGQNKCSLVFRSSVPQSTKPHSAADRTENSRIVQSVSYRRNVCL